MRAPQIAHEFSTWHAAVFLRSLISRSFYPARLQSAGELHRFVYFRGLKPKALCYELAAVPADQQGQGQEVLLLLLTTE